ncbi:glutamyl-tRNA reductase [Candidatus Endobugula sertula]|uniref:Glutamyl-tRNA reductase n=1 Tax=Candidatus Endobugula sertula TaxID=62101 RepID=A0A1D2QN17_9GAMM|nr:glutamyl-tRNA reductase [Candidatus Endobugula sertula]
MIPLFILGINHDSASIDVRERVAFAPEAVGQALQQLVQDTMAEEAAILSTCNRTELYIAVDEAANIESNQGTVIQTLLLWLADYHQLSVDTLQACHYSYLSEKALRHMMVVASGLDSLVLGEPQILGQMKSCYAVAQNSNTLSSELHHAFQKAFGVAKNVRTNTAIGENPVSVAYAAVNLAQQIFSDLTQDTALLIGAGETIELVARHLQQQGIGQMIFANRTLERAQKMADEFSAKVVLLTDIPEQLMLADIVISSTASQLPILGKGAVESALKQRRHKPIFMVDIAVPRDIEVEVGDLADVYLYTVDDLREVIDENKQSRETAASEAQKIIDDFLAICIQDYRARHSVSAIKSYRQHAESIRDQVLAKALSDLQNGLSPDAVVAQMANSLTNKLLHIPTAQLKQASTEGHYELLSLTKRLFAVDSVVEKK